MAFKTYNPKGNPKDEIDVSKEYTPKEIYSKLPNYTKQDKVLIYDADILSYKIASVTEFKYLYTSPEGDEYKVKSKKSFKAYCEENGLDIDSFTVENVQIAEPIGHAIKSMNDSVAKVMEYCGCNKVEFYIGGSGNFRNEIPLPVQYKTNRTETVRPIHLTALKDYLIKYKGAKKVCGSESDDVVNHRIRTLNKQGVRCVLYSNDKDCMQNVDYNLLNFNPDKADIIVSKKGVGELIDRGKDVKGSGLKWLILQVLLGDKIDGFTPKQFFNKKYADKAFLKDFDSCKTEVEVLDKFVEVAKRLVPDSVSYTSFTGQLMELNRKELFEMYYLLPKMRDGWCETLEELFYFYNLDVEMLNYE